MGFALEPGERLVFLRLRDIEAKKKELLILGLVTLPIFLIGLIFLLQAATAGKLPKVAAITTHRLVLVHAHGVPQSYWLRDVRDFWAVRQEANTSGQGALGAAIGAAVVMGMNAANAAKPKTDPGHWGRCIAITFVDHGGREMTLPLGEDTGAIGPVLSQLQAGWADRMPTVDPRVAARSAAPSPTIVGRMERILGAVLVLPFCWVLVRLGDLLSWGGLTGSNIPTAIVMMLVAGAGLGVFFWGTNRAKKAIASGATPKRNLLVGTVCLAIPFAGGIGGGVYEYVRSSSIRDELAPGRESKASSSSGGGSKTAAADGPRFSKERVAAVAAKRGLKLSSPSDNEFDTTPLYSVSLDGTIEGSPYVTLMDLRTPAQTSGDAHACGATGSHAVCVRVSGPGGMPEAEALKSALLAKLTASTQAVAAVVRARGYKVDKPDPDGEYTFGSRNYLVHADKGPNSIGAWVSDFSPIASGKAPGAAMTVGGQIVIVSTQYGPKFDAKGFVADVAR